MSTDPARIVVHKTSMFRPMEAAGIRAVAQDRNISSVDMVTVSLPTTRLLRMGDYPAYRGTLIEITNNRHILYTRGSVGYYKTYPGLYIPQPLEIRIVESDESPQLLCNEILSLTKMNWNNTRFNGRYPITLQCTKEVGPILKYVTQHETPQISYKFYM